MSTKSRVLESLLCAGDQFCSGGKLAAQCGVSRTAIWKAIEQLKAEGCEIEAVTNRGYRFRVMPDLYSEGYLRRLLEATGKSWNVRHYEEVGSTNQVAKELPRTVRPPGRSSLPTASPAAGDAPASSSIPRRAGCMCPMCCEGICPWTR